MGVVIKLSFDRYVYLPHVNLNLHLQKMLAECKGSVRMCVTK
jgi:hypothetical protein